MFLVKDKMQATCFYTISILICYVTCLGLGSIYGDQELRDVMDRHSELKIVNNALWKHFEHLV